MLRSELLWWRRSWLEADADVGLRSCTAAAAAAAGVMGDDRPRESLQHLTDPKWVHVHIQRIPTCKEQSFKRFFECLCLWRSNPPLLPPQRKKSFWSQFLGNKCNVTHWDAESALLCVTQLSDGFHKLVWRKKKKANQDTSVGFPVLCCDFKPFLVYLCMWQIYLFTSTKHFFTVRSASKRQKTMFSSFKWETMSNLNPFARIVLFTLFYSSFLTPIGSLTFYF